MAKDLNIILFGAPGAGKSTHVEMLQDAGVDFSLVSLGKILRDRAAEDSDTGRKIKETMSKGDLLDDFFIRELVKDALRDVDKSKIVILDGFPRTLGQLEVTDQIFADLEMALPIMIYIKITQEEAVRRLSGRLICSECKSTYQEEFLDDKEKCEKCGGKLAQREDDTPEAIKNRFDLFEMQIDLIKHYFETRGRYYEIDGLKERHERHEDIMKVINSFND